MKSGLTLIILLFHLLAFGQDATIFSKTTDNSSFEKISFGLSFEKDIITFGKEIIHQEDTFTLTQCKMYLSDVVLLDSNFNVSLFQKEPIFIDFSKENEIYVNKELLKKGMQINFRIGTDTILKGMPPLSGELASTKGMFWNWTSGFMALKIEGTHSGSSERQNNFVFHLGSNQVSSLPEVLWTDLSKRQLIFELKDIFLEHSFGAFPTVMEDNETTYHLLELFTQGFYVKP